MASESSTSRSDGGGGGATAESYVGSSISLTSKSEIRYEGVLININTEESSIGLRNVRSFGTEGRRKDGPQVPASDKIYEYILFRGSDIKDIQVKVSQPAQTAPAINTDPAIIQSHNPRPTIPATSLPAAPSGSLVDLGSHNAQMGLPGSTFQSGMPLYQPGGNMNSWAPPPQNANGSGLPMPMYWPGFYGTANGMSQLPQHSLLPPPPGLTMPPSMQQMQFSGFNSSLPPAASSLPSSGFPDYNSSLVSNSTSYSSLNSTTLPASSFPLNAPALQPVSLPSETMTNPLPNRAPSFGMPASAPSSSLPSLVPHSIPAPDNAGHTLAAHKPSAIPSSAALPPQTISQPLSSVSGTSGSVRPETLAPSLITPGQLLQSGPSTVSVPQPLQKTHKDVEVVQESPKQSPEPPVPAVTEAQPPILPLPPNARAHKPNGGSYHMRNSYRGRGGRGYGISRPVTKFTEDFDFTAMNEKFNKDEVWGHLGKSTKSQSNDNEGNGNGSDEEDSQYEDDAEFRNVEAKPVYNRDDFFDSLSSNSMDRNVNNNGRPRYSEQMKLDTETFGEFSRYRGGRGGRGGGRFRGSYNGRGNGGYGYMGRGRGRGTQYRAS